MSSKDFLFLTKWYLNLSEEKKSKILNLFKKGNSIKYENIIKAKKYKENKIQTKFKIFKNLINDAYFGKFIFFKSIINNTLILVYSSAKSPFYLCCYNLIDFTRINKIYFSGKGSISAIKHILDDINSNNKKDLILLSLESSLKLINFNNLETLLDISGSFESICLFKYYNQIYIISNEFSEKSFNFYDTHGKLVKTIKGIEFSICSIETYFDKKIKSLYIITNQREEISDGCLYYYESYIISYEYNKNKKYKEYNFGEFRSECFSLIIHDFSGILKLIGGTPNNIIIWNFHTGIILNTISFNFYLSHICLQNNQYLIGSQNNTFYAPKLKIKLIDLNKQKCTKDLFIFHRDHYQEFYFEKITHPYYGDCLIILDGDEIKLLIK